MKVVNRLPWWVDPFVCFLCRSWASFPYCTLPVYLSHSRSGDTRWNRRI